MAISTYPRQGHPIAPTTLATYLRRPAPFVPGAEPVWLCDLDASAWARFGETACCRFAEGVLQELAHQIAHVRAEMVGELLPPVPEGTRLRDLDLEARTFNRLGGLWQGKPMGGFSAVTIGDVMELRAFGTRCLVDLLTSMESFGLCQASPWAARPVGTEGPRTETLDPRRPSDVCKPFRSFGPVVPRRFSTCLNRQGGVLPAFANHRLPPSPTGLPLDRLGLGRRAHNALCRAGFQELGQLSEMTVGELLNLPGLGRSCLSELVAAAYEHALDGAACETASEQPVCAEAERLLRHIRSPRRLPDHVLGSPIPPLPPGLRLRQIGLQPATRNGLMRAGVWERAELLADLTLRDLLTLNHFGLARLTDLLECIGRVRHQAGYMEACLPHSEAGPLSSRRYAMPEVRGALARLSATPGIGPLGRGDPRLESWLRAIDPELETIDGLGRASDQFLATRDIARIVALCREVEQWIGDDYQTELLAIVLGRRRKARNEAIAKAIFCLEGEPPTTLDAIGREYGLTRERVRQICTPSRRCLPARPPFAPAMDRLLAAIEARIPCRAAALERQLVQEGLLNRGAMLEGVLRAAKVLQREPGFSVLGRGAHRVILNAEQAQPARGLRTLVEQTARREGIARFEAIRIRAGFHGREPDATVVELVAESVDGFRRLAPDGPWFLVGNWARGELARRVREILSVARSLSAAQLRTALRRDGLLRSAVPAEEVLLEFCRMLKPCHIARGRIRWNPSRPPAKTHRGREAVVVGLIERLGPTCTSEQLIEEAAACSVRASRVWKALQNCPSIQRLGPHRYALRRSATPAGQPGPKPAGALLASGQVSPDRFWAAYRATASVLKRGQLAVPGALAERVRSAFALRCRPGIAMGRVLVDGGQWTGLAMPLRYLAVEPGEVIRLDWDLARSVLLLRVGDDSLLDAPAPGQTSPRRYPRHAAGEDGRGKRGPHAGSATRR